jgi:eukaryotic-like serine/threonine-protein kinase
MRRRHFRSSGEVHPHSATTRPVVALSFVLICCDVAIQIARGLEAIHEIGLTHRDLKTAKKPGAEGSVGATAVDHIIGTPEYMSPEQARGEKIDVRSDIYAVGIMIFELFAGKVPFQAETPIATIFKHLQDPPPLDGPAAASIPASVIPVLARCLAKDPESRYPTAGAVVDALRDARAMAFPEASTNPLPCSRHHSAYQAIDPIM